MAQAAKDMHLAVALLAETRLDSDDDDGDENSDDDNDDKSDNSSMGRGAHVVNSEHDFFAKDLSNAEPSALDLESGYPPHHSYTDDLGRAPVLSSPLLKLPDEVLHRIIRMTATRAGDLALVGRVCRRLRDASRDDLLWKWVLLEHLGASKLPVLRNHVAGCDLCADSVKRKHAIRRRRVLSNGTWRDCMKQQSHGEDVIDVLGFYTDGGHSGQMSGPAQRNWAGTVFRPDSKSFYCSQRSANVLLCGVVAGPLRANCSPHEETLAERKENMRRRALLACLKGSYYNISSHPNLLNRASTDELETMFTRLVQSPAGLDVLVSAKFGLYNVFSIRRRAREAYRNGLQLLQRKIIQETVASVAAENSVVLDGAARGDRLLFHDAYLMGDTDDEVVRPGVFFRHANQRRDIAVVRRLVQHESQAAAARLADRVAEFKSLPSVSLFDDLATIEDVEALSDQGLLPPIAEVRVRGSVCLVIFDRREKYTWRLVGLVFLVATVVTGLVSVLGPATVEDPLFTTLGDSNPDEPSYGELVVAVPAGMNICEVSAVASDREPIKVVGGDVASDGDPFTCVPSNSSEYKHTARYEKKNKINQIYVRTTQSIESGRLQVYVDGLRFPDSDIFTYQHVISISGPAEAMYSSDECKENALQIAEVKVNVSTGSGSLVAIAATSEEGQHPAKLAADGDFTTFFLSANIVGTRWTAGVLGAVVERIEIYPRLDRCQGRMDKIKVELDGIDVTNTDTTAIANVLRFEQSVTWNKRGCAGEEAFITLCNVQVRDEMSGKEIKLFHAQQVSTYLGRYASLAIDGIVDGIPTKGHCAHSNQAKLAWWAAYFFESPIFAKVTWSQRKENVVRMHCVDGRMWNTHVWINRKDITLTQQNNWVRLVKSS
ncbi:Hypothetical Protein FCC1311_010282 [Hondaea fermentalgiana]|uniref:F-box domain-containing protein n=1 Tax=Hondaea fermentalgiana TaxID=2315210 RepID=A0A2R5G1C6_9STRA|nr:Hypothetical Protein FCC1311_010282 [Hondaea fermentalgiana]|eukprot:GBG24810.1 Hypothetical Protein FCC1311_010282 [Hondaea fermentalgiana]